MMVSSSPAFSKHREELAELTVKHSPFIFSSATLLLSGSVFDQSAITDAGGPISAEEVFYGKQASSH